MKERIAQPLSNRLRTSNQSHHVVGSHTLALVAVVGAISLIAGIVGPFGLAAASTGSGNPEATTTAPARVVVTASPKNVWTSVDGNATATITATVTTSNGQPAPNVPIQWSTTGGSLSAPTGRTNADGRAQVRLNQPQKVTSSMVVGVTATDANTTSLRSSGEVDFLPNRISIYPKSASGGPWEWYQSCPFIPSTDVPPNAKSGCQRSDPIFGPVVLDGDLWNLGSTAKGGVMMRNTTAGDLSVSANFTSAPSASGSSWVLGDPNVTYGIQPQTINTSPKPLPSLPLPMNVNALPKDLIATTNYKLAGTSSTRFDFSYDIWLQPQKAVETPRTGTLEIMVWTDDGNQALPPGYRGPVWMDYADNGVRKTGQWGVYITNGEKGSGTTTVQLVLTKVINKGNVAIDLTHSFQKVESALTNYYPTSWPSFSSYFLDSITLGSEFGRKTGSSGVGPFSWNLYNYSFGLGTKLP